MNVISSELQETSFNNPVSKFFSYCINICYHLDYTCQDKDSETQSARTHILQEETTVESTQPLPPPQLEEAEAPDATLKQYLTSIVNMPKVSIYLHSIGILTIEIIKRHNHT